jgi:hypothetical protein
MNWRGLNATQASRSYRLAGDSGLATTMLAPASRPALMVASRVSLVMTRIGMVRFSLFGLRLMVRVSANPPCGGSAPSHSMTSIL